tara:strand:- start:2543 stop:3538 length:996 start_codon:yes stop_codon:yes gene_type:complete
MILKYFELNQKTISNRKYFLLYGSNKGLIEETVNNQLKSILPKNIHNYDETEVLKNSNDFKESIFNKSFFEKEKLIIIQRVSDKLLSIIEEIIEKKTDDISFILISEILEKKSKIRGLFEKNKNTVCIPFYEDNNQTLSKIVRNFLKEININLSQQDINIIVERSRGDRINLNNELEKIKNFSLGKKKISVSEILKLTNLAENYKISDLVDNSLANNKLKTLSILNESNLNSEDCILILRIFLAKLKRLLKIKSELVDNDNIEKVLSNYKPAIFWKEKEILKQQIKVWSYEKIKDLIIKTNEIEYAIKKNPTISVYIVVDFVLQKSGVVNN